MKYALVIVILVLVSPLGFTQGHSIDTLDGDDWMESANGAKIAFVEGWFAADIEVLNWFEEHTKQMAEADRNQANSAAAHDFFYNQTIQDVVTMLDRFYADLSNRHFYIWSTIPQLVGKDWRVAAPATAVRPSTTP